MPLPQVWPKVTPVPSAARLFARDSLENVSAEAPGTRSAAPRQSRLAVAVRSLKHPNFQLFFAGQLISLIGTWMDTVAESWLVYRLTGSSLLLGSMAFASQIPVFLLAPIGGAVADRYN